MSEIRPLCCATGENAEDESRKKVAVNHKRCKTENLEKENPD